LVKKRLTISQVVHRTPYSREFTITSHQQQILITSVVQVPTPQSETLIQQKSIFLNLMMIILHWTYKGAGFIRPRGMVYRWFIESTFWMATWETRLFELPIVTFHSFEIGRPDSKSYHVTPGWINPLT
jgi:hypothetical protein